MQSHFFTESTYHTPPGRERIVYRLMLRSRIYYIFRFVLIVFRYYTVARSGGFSGEVWRNAARDVFRIVEDCGGRFSITGLDRLQHLQPPVVFVANHMSTMETFILPFILYPHETRFVLKEQLQRLPLFKHYVRDCIAVSRLSPSQDFRQVMKQGAEKLSQGISVILFPQATRSMTVDPVHFNSLGVKLARKAGVPVVPIALKTDFWGNGAIIKDFGPLDPDKEIYIEIGKPVEVHGSGKETHERVLAYIQERLVRWGAGT